MANVLDLKKTLVPHAEEPSADSEPVEPSVPEQRLERADLKQRVDETLALDGFGPQEMGWKASARMDAEELKRGRYMIGAMAVIAVLTAYWTGSFLLAVIAVLTVVAWEVHHRAADDDEVHIHKAGIRVNGHDYPFRRLGSFAIHEMPDETRYLSVRTSSRFTPHLRVPLGDTDHEQVRTSLAYHLDEDDHPVPISEIFLKS